jgi:2-polyprenyl-3-methyl-5-hydroxy-6-metoxy-1,4-benzoquinol methylase
MDYRELNKKAWDQKTEQHVHSEFYELDAFLTGKNVLRSIELDLLGNVKGKKILHLQCHFGLDSLSLARMGAEITGVDLSDKAVQKAKELNERIGANATFICCDLYDLPKHLEGQFDIVFTSYGTIGWLPDLNRWANVIKHFLKPNGRFVMVDFHPFIWTFDDDMKEISYDYFKSNPIIETIKGTYADRNAPIETTTVSWNHSLSDLLNSILTAGLELHSFHEYDYSPYNCFKNLIERKENEFVFEHVSHRIPMAYSIEAVGH